MRADKALTLFIKLLFGHCEIRTHDFLLKSSRFQDECHRPDSTKYPNFSFLKEKAPRGIEPLKKVLTVPRINHSAMIPILFIIIIILNLILIKVGATRTR